MPDTSTPIFYEALAAVAHCTPEEAREHFTLTSAGKPVGVLHPVEKFLEDYAA